MSLNHKNKELLVVLAQYAQLGAAIAQEEQDYNAGTWFAKKSIQLASKLGDNTLLAGGLMSMGDSSYRKKDYSNARKYIDEALSLKLPAPILGAVSLDAARIYSASGGEGSVKLLETATSIARKVTSWDSYTIQADLGFCHIRGATVFLNRGDVKSAQEQIEIADGIVSNKFMRRRAIIQSRQADILIRQAQYHDALFHAENALTLAKDLGDNENLMKGHILHLSNQLSASSFGPSRDVKMFSNRVNLFIGDRNIKPDPS